MTLNLRQQELLRELVQNITLKFPDVQYLGFGSSPYGEQTVWVNMRVPDDETMLAMSEYAAELESAILVEYGYSFSIMPRRNALSNMTEAKELV